MSYICHALNQHVAGKPWVLVPTEIREVKYVAVFYIKRRDGSEDKVYDGESIGWEVVKEVPVAQEFYNDFIIDHKPTVVEWKTVEFVKTRPEKKFIRKSNLDDDKPETE